MESILTSIKKLLGITEEYTHFDTDLIIHINSVFMILHQLGVGPSGGFSIAGPYEKWSDYIPNYNYYESVKSYVYLKVKLLFDPPLSSAVMESTNNLISELEYRLCTSAELNITKEESSDE